MPHLLRFPEKEKPTQAYSREIDLIFTDGYDLFLLEAKSGGVKQQHIQELENLANRFGGAFGRDFLLPVFPSAYGTIPNRMRESMAVAFLAGGVSVRFPKRPSIPSRER